MTLERFKDYESDIKDRWSEEALALNVLWGLLRGDDQGNLRPRDTITREEVAIMFKRLLLSTPAVSAVSYAMRSLIYIQANKGPDGWGVGSGFWFPHNWYAVTNAHVAAVRDTWEPALEFRILGHPAAGFDPVAYMTAEVVSLDHGNDLALLKVHKPPYEVTPVPIVPSDKDPQAAQEVWALGHPANEEWDTSRGIIRNPFRIINYWNQPQQVMGLDVPLNPGNSGGLLINAKGRLVGVGCAGRMSMNNMTYAIPVSIVEQFVSMISTGEGDNA